MWINVARVSAIIAGIGILYSPTVASVALVATYVAFLASGQVVVRFRQVFGRPSVYWAAIFLAVVLIGMTYASVPWSDRGTDLLKWRTILWFVVLLSIFDDERWKTRLLVMFIVGTAVGLVISFVAAAGWVTLLRGPGALLRNSATQSMGFAVAALLCLWMFLEKSLQGHMRWIVPVLGLLYVANIAFYYKWPQWVRHLGDWLRGAPPMESRTLAATRGCVRAFYHGDTCILLVLTNARLYRSWGGPMGTGT